MAEKKILGSIYLDGVVQKPGFVCDASTNISIGDTVRGKELEWVVAGNRLVADRCACCDINWTQINAAGYNVGRPVFVDGKPYECRSLSVVPSLKQTASEWDGLLDEFGEDNLLWHWKEKYFWGSEIILCGVQSARFLARGFKASDRAPSIGFRPVLEPLLPASTDLSGQEGRKIRLHGAGRTIIEGTLVSADDYDIVVDGVKMGQCDWAIGDGKGIVANKSKILWLTLPTAKAGGILESSTAAFT